MTRESSVEAFLDTVDDPERRRDAEQLLDLMGEITGEQPTMWGTSIIGFGRAHYRYASGREGDTPMASFSPRKRELVVYLAEDLHPDELPELDQLGPHRAGKACLYLKRWSDVDREALRAIIARSARARRDADPTSRAER